MDEEVVRRLELKKVLLLGIEKSLRRDCDYQMMVDLKYHHILYRIFMDAKAYGQAEAHYRKLKEHNEVRCEEYQQYLQVWHPVKYKLHCGYSLVRRALGKIKRTIIQ